MRNQRLEMIKALVRGVVPRKVRGATMASFWPPVGHVDMGQLRRTRPISRQWGSDRGLPVDRWYIERFLGERSADIHGRVLEVGSADYTRRFGSERVVRSDVVGPRPEPGITICADLSREADFDPEVFDCVVLTQTLPFIYDVPAVIRTLYRVLKPGGIVLATTGGITKIDLAMQAFGHYWSFTSASASRLFGDVFGAQDVEVRTGGNVLSAAAFLYGLAAEELTPAELEVVDPEYEVIITIRARRRP